MKQLYEQVRMDTEIRLFYIQCPICNKRKYGNVAPFLCWGKKRLEHSSCASSGTIMQKHNRFSICPDILISVANAYAGSVISAMTWKTARVHVSGAKRKHKQ